MKIQIYSYKSYTQLCNLLYFVLQIFIKNKNNKDTNLIYKYKCDSQYQYNQLLNLNLEEFIVNYTNDNEINIDSYCQNINTDFSISDLVELVNNYILKSDLFAKVLKENSINNSDSIAIHIRNTDFLNKNKNNFHNCFNRVNYIKNAFNLINNKGFSNLYVFSDDIALCIKSYDKLFKDNFENIFYMDKNDAEYDLLKLSLFKTKILWNSTYSYWSAFISNVIYENSEQNIIVPSLNTKTTSASNTCNKYWNFITVI